MTVANIKKEKVQKKKKKKKKRLKFENYKRCLEATKFENKINFLENNEINIDNITKDHKEFLRNIKLILKTLESFKSDRHNAFIKEINKITLS